MPPSHPQSAEDNTAMPQTPVKKSSHPRGIPDLAWFFQDGYPTPYEKHVKNDVLAKEASDDGTVVDLLDDSTTLAEESDTDPSPEDESFVVQDGELLHADDDYVPRTHSSVDWNSIELEDDLPELQSSKKRAYSSSSSSSSSDYDGDENAKRRRLSTSEAEMESEVTRITAQDSEGQDRKGGEWTRLLGFASDIIPSDPDLYFAALQLENREPHALSDIEFPPELFAALDQAYAKILLHSDDKTTNRKLALEDRTTSPPSGPPHPEKNKNNRRRHLCYIPTEHSNRGGGSSYYYYRHRALRDLELANEIALARFRDLCHARLPGVAHEHFGVFGPGPRDGWARARASPRHHNHHNHKFTWWVGVGDGDGEERERERERGCVALGAVLPGTGWWAGQLSSVYGTRFLLECL
ncbi:hypothetical protein F5X96DRAFT_686292 [Biscogniauxia mediterranea]|nr:hypothetical protein F5X96DRAFT_686292 [Biscogniauxia mediterranea]